jgi:hypothetical protein
MDRATVCRCAISAPEFTVIRHIAGGPGANRLLKG